MGRREYWFLLAVAALYLPLTFLGIGSDGDSDAVMRTVHGLIDHHVYAYSRPPGFPVQEAGSALAYLIAGPIGPNLASLAMSLAVLALVLHLCRTCRVPHPFLVAAGVASNPFFIMASTSTIDYAWGTAFILAGTVAIAAGSPILAGLAFGFACGARLSCVLLTIAILGARAVAHPESRWQALSALVLAGCVTILWYVPAFVAEGYSFGFVKVLVPGWWGGWGLPARWVYKNIYLFGLPAIVAGAIILARRGERPRPEHRDLVLAGLGVIAAIEAVFMRVPIEIGYLLPMLPFVWLLFGIRLRRRPGLLAVLVILQMTYLVMNVNIAKPDVVHEARTGRLGFWVEAGALVSDTRERLARERVRQSH